MSNLNSHNYIKHYDMYHRMMYVFAVIVAVLTRLFKLTEDTGKVIIFCFVIAAFFATDLLLQKLQYFDSSTLHIAFKYAELICFAVFQAFIPTTQFLLVLMCVFSVLLSIEFALYDTEYDTSAIFVRRIMLIIVLIINIGAAFAVKSETEWLCYTFAQAAAFCVVFFMLDWLIGQNEKFEKRTSRLLVEKSDIESANEKLLEYQNRVKAINEQINYQKIDLARVIKELEQANTEIESQTEIMKYMASTFDILKCIDVITDSIVNVKKTKICALYVDKNVYMNKLPSFVVKTNYTSLEHRLKKDIDDIYQDFIGENKSESVIYKGEALRHFRFIGDANIKAMAFLPLMDGTKEYGIMIVASDEENYFDKGLAYYETAIVEFNVAVKSTNLYLQMQDMARKDGLTGIYNRLYFKELFSKAAKRAVDENQAISVALFDIDKFKSVNDTYGHLAGDEVIKMVAGIGSAYAEKYNGFACRYGGEEFLLVLPNRDEHEMLAVLEEMHEEIKATKVHYNDLSLSVNVCIGYSTYPSICKDTDLLVSRADKAMYYGKRNGRGRLVKDNPAIDSEDDIS